ncbi:hypothetical protein RHSIM_Rhsim06G0055800 [Rhododendron simsii]|uniref:non-specific serine/threonine protein kinase n=1 Tax=Rhododendron simsii TaxID=118357 RepID=A0A834GTF3_RHOSS|nr:hypothetical protein RHSIM_Rhsim06G0055800 [Rhododendron simsii]
MITGRSPVGLHTTGRSSVGFQYTTIDDGGLVTWMRKKQQGAVNSKALIKEIIDPTLIGGYEMGKMETLVRVAMQCVEEDKDARPTMRKVVEMLLRHEDEDSCDNGAEVKDFVPFQ